MKFEAFAGAPEYKHVIPWCFKDRYCKRKFQNSWPDLSNFWQDFSSLNKCKNCKKSLMQCIHILDSAFQEIVQINAQLFKQGCDKQDEQTQEPMIFESSHLIFSFHPHSKETFCKTVHSLCMQHCALGKHWGGGWHRDGNVGKTLLQGLTGGGPKGRQNRSREYVDVPYSSFPFWLALIPYSSFPFWILLMIECWCSSF